MAARQRSAPLGRPELAFFVQKMYALDYEGLESGPAHPNLHKQEVLRRIRHIMERRFGIRRSALQLRKKWADLRYKTPQLLAELRTETRRERHRRQQAPAPASMPSSATSGSPQPGTSHAVRTRSDSTPPQATTPPFRHSSSSPGSAAFSPEATIPAAAVARARGWEVSSSSTSSGDEQPASLLQSTTLRELLAKQKRLEGTAERLLKQVKQQGRTLRHLLAHRRGRI
ncbi:uncharacterized protein LOC143787373 [Ranitomeya variabilis]|uniref:uncharacterized protein LOC143787372 n=1 Tax=Ranitomeya variabilis TaxID=490064 RepID=UPI004057AB7C